MKVGQIYLNNDKPTWRKNESKIFVITNIFNTKGFASIIWQDGQVDHVSKEWINGDCTFLNEFAAWQDAINSDCFKLKVD